jgi:oligopeptide/dipeptide ABC transporter ATP-binding protein
MYGGQIAEMGPIEDLYYRPQHPYTQRLLGAYPAVGGVRELAPPIDGVPPDPSEPPTGCRFHPRCHKCQDICTTSEVDLRRVGDDQVARCLFAPWPKGELDPLGIPEAG